MYLLILTVATFINQLQVQTWNVGLTFCWWKVLFLKYCVVFSDILKEKSEREQKNLSKLVSVSTLACILRLEGHPAPSLLCAPQPPTQLPQTLLCVLSRQQRVKPQEFSASNTPHKPATYGGAMSIPQRKRKQNKWAEQKFPHLVGNILVTNQAVLLLYQKDRGGSVEWHEEGQL